MSAQNYRVSDKAPSGLYLRTEPVVKESTKILILPMGKKVTKISDSNINGWWQVSADLQGDNFTGYVNSSFLVKVSEFTEPAAVKTISSVHLSRPSPVTRKNKVWAYPLNESGQPARAVGNAPADRAESLTEIVEWLDVEKTTHLRYKPIPSATYCNIYAYDYCYLSGVYLPRVWWLSKALIDLSAGKEVTPVYGATVGELNANSLFNWFKDFGATFGWKRTASLDEMQDAANNGRIAIICAQNRVPNRSGHICPVVPETNAHQAERKNGAVVKPLQSQAGRVNRKYQTLAWWTTLASTFREHGFWINGV